MDMLFELWFRIKYHCRRIRFSILQPDTESEISFSAIDIYHLLILIILFEHENKKELIIEISKSYSHIVRLYMLNSVRRKYLFRWIYKEICEEAALEKIIRNKSLEYKRNDVPIDRFNVIFEDISVYACQQIMCYKDVREDRIKSIIEDLANVKF